MSWQRALVGLAAGALAAASAGDASACGGCFVQQSESTQVASHRMILSVSNDATTLWDQIIYTGAPESFAWVLPIRGTVDVGLSSDAMFAALEAATEVTVSSPPVNCPPPPDCRGNFFAAGSAEDGQGGGGGVTVLAEQVVGPYETVQLASTDPAALTTWLDSHGYAVAADVAPVIEAYVAEGFDFLALKLVPGQGIDAMRPVRVTTPGAAPVLPLRMVSAGTGAVTPITLWVVGEGRYESASSESFVIDPKEIVWDWDAQKSNYADLRDAAFEAKPGAWLLEAAEPLATYLVGDVLLSLAQAQPLESGYADESGQGALTAAADDIERLYGALAPSALTVTRLYAELPRAWLGADLELGASADQSQVTRAFVAQQSTGTPPACPPAPSCGDDDREADSGCAMGRPPSSRALFALAAAGLAGLAARRRRRR